MSNEKRFKEIISNLVRSEMNLPEHWTHDQFSELENEIYHTVLLCMNECTLEDASRNFWTFSQFAGNSSQYHISLNGHFQFVIHGETEAKGLCERLNLGDNAQRYIALIQKHAAK